MNTKTKYVLMTAIVVFGTLFLVQKIEPLRDLVYGAPPKTPPSTTRT